jgi:hypothetical protein
MGMTLNLLINNTVRKIVDAWWPKTRGCGNHPSIQQQIAAHSICFSSVPPASLQPGTSFTGYLYFSVKNGA